MAPCSVVVLDLDGTLLRSDKTISEATRGVLRKLAERGVDLVTATARPQRAVRSLLPPELLTGWIILCNGSQIRHATRLVYECEIPGGALAAIVAAVQSRLPDPTIGYEHRDRLYVNRHFVRHWPADTETLADFSAPRHDGALKVLIDWTDPTAESWLRVTIPPGTRLILTDHGTLAQIIPAEVGKAAAVRFVLQQLAKGMADVVCFGDDLNDAELFVECPHSVAMANAPAPLRRLAFHQAPGNDEDGVARYLKAYFRL